MNLVVSLEHRFKSTPDGEVWTQAGFGYSFWKRYLDVFDQVQVVSRVLEVATVPPDHERADGERVLFVPLPCYVGPERYLLNLREIKKTIRSTSSVEASFIARVPSPIGTLMLGELSKRQHPYGLEVVADPRDAFTRDAIQYPFRPFFRWWFSRNLVKQCAKANAAAYVTEHALQRRYPCPAFSVGASGVDLPEEAYVRSPRLYPHSVGVFTLVFVGSLAQRYKAPHILIDAIGICVKRGFNLQLIIVGDGKHRSELEARAKTLGLADLVIFLGQLQAGGQVREQLDKADLFVLPSYTEGLPKAMLEAMARGLPCIGTAVGGIPELLPEEDMVPPGDANALAEKIRDVLSDPERLSRMAERNLKKTHEYSDQVLPDKRATFYKYVRDVTENWLSQNAS
jgi:glycosyltransferase involved in cell wall biosynthesis